MPADRCLAETSQPGWLRRWLPLVALLLLTVGLRLPGVTRPLLGNFATKSVVYAMIARNWAEGRADWRWPTLDCLVGGQRSLHLLEWPVSAYLTGELWRRAGGSLDVWGRAVAIAWSAAAVGLLYRLVRRRHGPTAALGAGLLLALSPVGIIYGQCFMLEPSLVLFTLVTVDGLDRWLSGGRTVWLIVAAVGLALLLLTKIYMLALLLPLGAWVLWPEAATVPPRRWPAAVALGVALLPAALWYAHAAHAAAPGGPQADRVFYSVRQSTSEHWPPHPLLRSGEFYRRVLDDLPSVVLTPVGLALVLAGLLHPAARRYFVWLLAMAMLVLLLPRKFFEMNYYWLAVVPPLAILAGLGWDQIVEHLRPSRRAAWALLVLGLVFALRYAVRPAFITPPEDRAVVAAGQAMQALADAEEPIVTMHGSGIDLLYYCHRAGWYLEPGTPELAEQLEECRRQGAKHLVYVATSEPLPEVLRDYQTCGSGDGYTIYALTPHLEAER